MGTNTKKERDIIIKVIHTEQTSNHRLANFFAQKYREMKK